jgi:hypothetical protein
MHNRNAGESFPRPIPRLHRAYRFRPRASHSDVKRRASSSCPPPLWPAGLLPAAAATPSDATWRRVPSHILRYRDTRSSASDASAPSLAPVHVASVPRPLRGLPAAPANGPRQRAQAQSSRRSSAVRSSKSHGAAARRLWPASSAHTSWTVPRIFPPTLSSAAHPARHASATASPPPPQPASC